MKRFNGFIWAAGLAAALGTAGLLGQDTAAGADATGGNAGRRNRGGGAGGPGGGGPGGGNFDPAQFRQRMMDRYREQLAIKDDSEWKIVQERIEKVSDARRDIPRGGGFGGGRGGGPGGPGGPGGGATTSPEAEALQKAVDGNASADEIKSKLANYRDAVKQKEAKLEKAQAGLREVLSSKQEAAAVLAGLLK